MHRSAVLLVCLLLLGSAASAQQIRGAVIDATSGRPVDRAVLVMLDADSAVRASTFSAADGSFLLNAPINRDVRVRVQRMGYQTHRSDAVVLARNESVDWRIELRSDPVALEGITATAPTHPNLERFMTNRESGFGQYLGPDEIARLNPRSTSNLLLGMSGSPFQLSGTTGRIIARARGGSSASLPGGTCVPHVYIDGFILEEEANPLPWARSTPVRTTPVRERGIALESAAPGRAVRGVEVYANPINAPAEFQRSFRPNCVVLAIWTDFGFGFGKSRSTPSEQ
jgi:hypothetical protein